ncbi:hypothetical protein BH09VER1_BH09VER1_13050 [soil metagenome]
MKTILAHLKKDLISSRGLLIAWASCVALAFLFFILRVAFPNPSWLSPQSNPDELFKVVATVGALFTGIVGAMGIQFLLLTLILVQIIHLDPLTNPDAFWRTRPISGGSLLAAKSLFAALLVIGAFLSTFALHLNESTWPTTFLSILVFVTGLAAIAAITTSISQMILHWLAITIIASLAAHAVLAGRQLTLTSLHGTPFSASFSQHLSTPSASSSFGFTALYFIGFLGAILCQYFTLRTNLSRALLFATFFLAILLKNGS